MAFSIGAGPQLGIAGVQGYLGNGWQGAAQNVGQTALGMVPYVGPMLQGAAQGAMSGGVQDPQMPNLGGLRRAGINQTPDAGSVQKGGLMGTSKLARVVRGVGAGALSAVPYVGPALSAAGFAANSQIDKRNAMNAQNVAKNQMGQLSSLAQRAAMNQRAQKAGMSRNRLTALGAGAPGGGAAMLRANAPRGQMTAAPSTNAAVGVNPAQPSTGGQMVTAASRNPLLPPRRPDRGSVANASTAVAQQAAGTEPYGTEQGYRNTLRNARGKRGIARQADEILAQQMREGLDPRILSGLNQGAINSAQDTRQRMADALARTGDSSGYETGTRAGMDMALANQLSQIYPEWLQKRQDWINDLVFKWRGTRRGAVAPTPNPSGGTDWGSIMQGVGALGNTAANMYSTFNQPSSQTVAQQNYWNSGNTGPAPRA